MTFPSAIAYTNRMPEQRASGLATRNYTKADRPPTGGFFTSVFCYAHSFGRAIVGIPSGMPVFLCVPVRQPCYLSAHPRLATKGGSTRTQGGLHG